MFIVSKLQCLFAEVTEQNSQWRNYHWGRWSGRYIITIFLPRSAASLGSL